MITTKINIKPHLAEYVNSKFLHHEKECVVFPDKLDIYHTIWDLLEKRPSNSFKDEGNVILGLPDRRIGKDPEYFNYLGVRSIELIQKRIETMFHAEFRAFMDENKHRKGITFKDSSFEFIAKYDIESFSADALYKDFYRWRKTVAGRITTTRNYEYKNQK